MYNDFMKIFNSVLQLDMSEDCGHNLSIFIIKRLSGLFLFAS